MEEKLIFSIHPEKVTKMEYNYWLNALRVRVSEGVTNIFWAEMAMPCADDSSISKHHALEWAMNHKWGEVWSRQRPLWMWMWWCGYSLSHVRLCGKHKEGQAETHGSYCSQRHNSISPFNLILIPSLTGKPTVTSDIHKNTRLCLQLMLLLPQLRFVELEQWVKNSINQSMEN